MRIVGLLSWYDENPAWLKDAITSYYRCGVEHLVALDGAYLLLEGGRGRSPRKQAKAIVDTCDTLGMALTLYQPPEPWAGNEVEKRTALFRLAEAFTTEDDWYVVIDSDEVVETPKDLRRELADVQELAAKVTLIDRYSQDDPLIKANPGMPLECPTPIRKVFRALRGLHCEGNHFTYAAGEHRLWGNGDVGCVDAFDLLHLRVMHRSRERNLARHRQQAAYYRLRDEVGAELLHGAQCAYCEDAAIKTVDGNPQRQPNGVIVTDRVPVCAKHWKRPLWDTGMQAVARQRAGLAQEFAPQEIHALMTEDRVNRFEPR